MDECVNESVVAGAPARLSLIGSQPSISQGGDRAPAGPGLGQTPPLTGGSVAVGGVSQGLV